MCQSFRYRSYDVKKAKRRRYDTNNNNDDDATSPDSDTDMNSQNDNI